MKTFDYYVILIFIVKICFFVLMCYYLYLQAKGKANTPKGKNILFWKEHFEFIFTALMSVLLIYVFYPRKNRMGLIDNETKLLLYLFGFILLMTANWKLFIGTSPLIQKIQSVIGR